MRRECNLLIGVILTLLTIGVVAVYSANAAYSTLNMRFLRHVLYVIAGLAVFSVAAHVDYRKLGAPFVVRVVAILGLTLLVAVLIPGVGVVRGGAQRWIEIGPVSFQPSECAKFALILALAYGLSRSQDQITSFNKTFLPYVGLIFLFAGLIVLERDLGTPAVIVAAGFCMLLVAGVPMLHISMAGLVAVGGVAALAFSSEYRMRRLLAFRDPWSHRNEDGYQLIQSLTAFVNGSIWGQGPGGGEQKLYYLPEAHTDFIFAVWSEEMGLVGSMLLVFLFLALFAVAMHIALHAKDLFGSLLASGAVALIAVQALFNMMVAVGMLPTKGLPLPFISMGGTSLLVFMGLMGIVVNVGLQAQPVRRRALAMRAA
jgi:cell division protein FtsW